MNFLSEYLQKYTYDYILTEALKAAMRQEIAYRYEHRGDEDIKGLCDAALVPCSQLN